MNEYESTYTATKTRYYFGSSCEREVVGSTTTQYIWIGGDAYTAVAVAKKVMTGSWVVYNIFRDHLGTITHLKTGSTISEYSFDAWGRRRDKVTWSYTLDSEPAQFADRGFTAHEYLEDFKLYNMNGRLYDPVVGRFLSPDPYVQEPSNTQSYNRYSYCLNNPLKYTDPSGNKWNWNWLNPMYHFVNIMQAINDHTTGLRNKMEKAGVPNFTVGMNVNLEGNVNARGEIRGQEVFNTANHARSKAEQIAVQNAAASLEGVRGQRGVEWHAAAIAGAIDFSYNMIEGNQYLGTGITTLSSYLTGRKAYFDYKKGGWTKVSKSDMISTSAGVVSIGPKMAQWGGLGRIALYAGESANFAGAAVFIYDLWWNAIYKPMNDLRFAPNYIDNNGVPNYGEALPPIEYYEYWGYGY